ncbi:MAG: hypothetical protein WC414_04320 [Patescibacteria group bacterium]
MKIKELQKILEETPNKEAQVFINYLPQNKETDISYKINENDDLDLFIK